MTKLNANFNKIFIVAAIFCTITAVSYREYKARTMNEQERLVQANIEALTDNEYDFSDGYPYNSICKVKIETFSRCKVEIITCQGGGSGCNEKSCPVHNS